MYSGLLPTDLTEDDLSPDEEEKDEAEDAAEENFSAENLNPVAENRGCVDDDKSTQTGNDADSMPGISREMWQVGSSCFYSSCCVDGERERHGKERRLYVCVAHVQRGSSKCFT